MVVNTTLEEIQKATIAHTDVGPILILDDKPCQEAIVEGKITKIRPSMIYVGIGDNTYTVLKKSGFEVGDVVKCRLSFSYEHDELSFTVLSIEKK